MLPSIAMHHSRKNNGQKILVVVGPTAAGKSALAVTLARRLNGEIISADSRQVYRGLDIGTGKITKREMRGIRHHVLDVASPEKTFTAHDFVKKGRMAMTAGAKRGTLSIVAGGTGFYIDALLGRIILPDVPADKQLRSRLKKKSAPELFAMLKKRDPRRASMIDRHNKVRVIRALEIAQTLGRVPQNTENRSRYDVLWVGIALPKKELGKSITARLLACMRRGMVAEARRLHKEGLSYKRMESLGLEYRSLARFLQGKITRADMLIQLDRDIRRYARRQMTYWRRNKNIEWFEPSERRKITRRIERWLKK